MGNVRLDKDVHELLKQRKQSTGASIEYLANNVLRDGLGAKVKVAKQSAPKTEKSKRFIPPSVDEVYHYFFLNERSMDFAEKESRKFVNFYASKGWKVGKSPMKVWKGAAANWLQKAREDMWPGPAKSIHGDSTRNTTLQDELTDRSWAE